MTGGASPRNSIMVKNRPEESSKTGMARITFLSGLQGNVGSRNRWKTYHANELSLMAGGATARNAGMVHCPAEEGRSILVTVFAGLMVGIVVHRFAHHAQ